MAADEIVMVLLAAEEADRAAAKWSMQQQKQYELTSIVTKAFLAWAVICTGEVFTITCVGVA